MDTDTIRDARALVTTELRVRWRRFRGDRRKLVATATPLFLFGVLVPYWVHDAVITFGRELATPGIPTGTAAAGFTGIAIGIGYVGGAAGFSQEGTGTVGPLIRTSIPPDAVSLGRFASETLRANAFLGPATVVLLALVGVGSDGPLAPVLFGLSILPVALAGLLVGRLVGDGLRYLNRRVGISLWAKAALTVVLTTLIFVATQMVLYSGFEGSEGSLGSVSIPAFLPGEPMQAYAETVLAPVGGTVQPLGVVVLAVFLLAIPVALVAALRFETSLLLQEASASEADEVEGTSGVPRPFDFGPTSRVAWRYLLRTRRDPRTLAHLMPLLFGGMAMGASVVQNPDSAFTFLSAAAVIGGGTIAGAAYCLNPLGDDVDQLSFLLTSVGSTAVLLRGRALAGMVLGLAIAVGLGTPLALVEHSPAFVVWQSVLAVVLSAGGAGVALGLGALFPKFERREYMSVERPHPSNYALFGLFFGGIVVGGLGLVLVGTTTSGGTSTAVGAAWILYALVVGGLGLGGYVYAVRRFDDLSMDDL